MSYLVDAERFKALAEQKSKLFQKVISDTGVYTNLMRIIDTRDLFSDIAYSLVADVNLASMLTAFLFDVPPIEIEPYSYLMDAYITPLEYILQGIDVESQKEYLDYLIDQIRELIESGQIMLPEGVDYSDFLNSIINPDIGVEKTIHSNIDTNEAIDISQTVPTKGYYDETRYDESYYDPPNVIDFVRATIYKLFNDRGDLQLLAKDILAIAEKYNIDREAAIGLFNRISLLHATRYTQFILGFSLLGASLLNDTNKVPFIDIDGNIIEVQINRLEDAMLGFILGVTPLGYGYLPKDKSFVKELFLKYKIAASPEEEKYEESTLFMFEILERKISQMVKNYIYTPLFFANYSRPEERTDFRRNETVDIWQDLQGLRYAIESKVDSILSSYEVSPIERRLYKSAALNLMSYYSIKNSWGTEFFDKMTFDEYKEFWLSHWGAQGLNMEVLNKILGEVASWLTQVIPQKRMKSVERKYMRKMQSLLGSYLRK